jgi:hypothetical protein
LCTSSTSILAVEVLDDFQHPRTQTLPGLRGRMSSAELRRLKSPADLSDGSPGKREQIAL